MQESQPTPSRRGFFFAAAAVTALPHIQSSEPTPEAHPAPPERGGGYHLSEHVKRYYKTTRL